MPSFFDCDRTLPEDQQATGLRTGSKYGFVSLISCKRQRGDTLEHSGIRDEWHLQYPLSSLLGHTVEMSVEMFSLRLLVLDEAKAMTLALWEEHACDERPTKSRPLLVRSGKRRRPYFVPNLRN